MTNLSLADYPTTKWITSDPDGLWHLGKRHERRGSRTNNLHAVYYLTACSGKQLGGPWGQVERTELPSGAGVCARCAAIAAKAPAPAEAPAVKVEKPYDPTKSTDRYEALVLEHTCGSTKTGEEVVLSEAGQPFARMIHDTEEARALALRIVTQLNDSTERGSRPSRQQARIIGQRFQEECQRNREHVAKTIALNMKLAEPKHEMLKNLIAMNTYASLDRAQELAADLYGARQFVTGVIMGRCYALPDAEQEALKRSWEDQWDTAFGDLVGKTLKMQ